MAKRTKSRWDPSMHEDQVIRTRCGRDHQERGDPSSRQTCGMHTNHLTVCTGQVPTVSYLLSFQTGTDRESVHAALSAQQESA